MNKCLQKADVPKWKTKGKIPLIQKDTLKVAAPKQLQIYNVLAYDGEDTNGTIKERDWRLANKPQIVSWGTERMTQRSRRTEELLYINQHILSMWKTRQKYLAMAGVDYTEGYDMVSQSWIINCLKMYEKSDEVIHLIEKNMKTWWVELTVGGKS